LQPVIQVVGLTKVFKDFWYRARVKAVQDVDLTVEPGEIYGLLGPNGSGKSTTIKIILGLLHPTRGRISVLGQPPFDVRTKRRIGYLPEESYLYRFLNARETLGYYATLFQLPRAVRKRRIEELLEMVGLRSAARRPVGEYSKGMQRRIGLAQALINDPDLLILDEPTSGLDPLGSKLVKDIIVRLGSELRKTILLSSHLLADVEEVCSRVTILYGGRVREQGAMEQVLAQRDKTQFTGERLDPETIEAIRRIVREREGKDLLVTTPRDRLESLFLRIVQQAHREQVETHGSQMAGALAGFFGQGADGQALLDSLVKPAQPAPEAAQSQPVRADEAVLADLAQPTGKQASPAPQRPAAAAPVDRDVLEELRGGSDESRS
jgi:ABC-2 type transport system ATP-binding protein